nr:Chain B, ICP27 [Human alphaherpesvirus 1]
GPLGSVWSRLGARRPSCSPERHGGKVARLQPPPTKAQPAR